MVSTVLVLHVHVLREANKFINATHEVPLTYHFHICYNVFNAKDTLYDRLWTKC